MAACLAEGWQQARSRNTLLPLGTTSSSPAFHQGGCRREQVTPFSDHCFPLGRDLYVWRGNNFCLGFGESPPAHTCSRFSVLPQLCLGRQRGCRLLARLSSPQGAPSWARTQLSGSPMGAGERQAQRWACPFCWPAHRQRCCLTSFSKSILESILKQLCNNSYKELKNERGLMLQLTGRAHPPRMVI